MSTSPEPGHNRASFEDETLPRDVEAILLTDLSTTAKAVLLAIRLHGGVIPDRQELMVAASVSDARAIDEALAELVRAGHIVGLAS
jgi:hypothetical protein